MRLKKLFACCAALLGCIAVLCTAAGLHAQDYPARVVKIVVPFPAGGPADVMARITDALTAGSSIIVADQGLNQGETGEGTDFIVSLR